MLDSKFWEKYFEVYDVLNLLIPYQELLDTISGKLDIEKGERVLDAGCGTGNLAIKMKKKGAEVVGLDYCKEALEMFRKKDPNAKLVLTDLTKKIPFPDNYFDKIACNNVLYTIPRDKQLATLKEFHRVLKPGGKIVLANIKKGWNPFKIYTEGVKKNFKQEGISRTFYKITRMVVPTIRILYYNRFIQKESEYYLFEFDEQKEKLQQAGFSKISLTTLTYANQGVLNSAYKKL